MRAATEILSRLPKYPVVLYGDEPHEPYNRVRLSTWLAGEVSLGELAQPLRRPFGSKVDLRFGYEIVHIDRAAHTVTDSSGNVQGYSKLILATGSSAFKPDIRGIDLDGVYCLRDLNDALALMARRARSHHTVVLGGGLLGLETARAMQRDNTHVTVIEHADRLLARQLDIEASAMLQRRMDELGLDVIVQDGVAEIQGNGRVTGVKLHSRTILACDSVVLATGISPRISLAYEAGLNFGRGITVDDAMRTSDPDIYAVGECVEHRGVLYGLVAPGFEQASVAAAHIAGQHGQYSGSIAASRLKVLGTTVFSMGPMGDSARSTDGTRHIYRNAKDGSYRKILVNRHRLVGALGVGEWPESVRLQSAIGVGERFYPWQTLRFKLSGKLWSSTDTAGAKSWPEHATVCQCTGTSKGKICYAIAQGAQSLEQVSNTTGAGTVCGSCKPLVMDLLGGERKLSTAGWSRGLVATATLSLLLTLMILFAPVISYATSVQASIFLQADDLMSPVTEFIANALSQFELPGHWDEFWRNKLLKQITGFSILALFVIGLLISIRKRLPKLLRIGRYDTWRFAHVILGTCAVLLLVAHTGFRLGHGLNYWLMLCFVGLLAVGTVSGIVVGLEHRLGASIASALRRYSIWIHILLFWPVPVLLAWHIFKGYWY